MGRERRRLLIDPPRLQQATAGLVALTPAESRYLGKVLRFGSGAVFAISDGAGGLWEAELLEPQRARLLQPLGAPLLWQPPPTPPLVLLAALVKRDYDLVLRMAVELGADWLLPCRADYDAVAGQPNLERWRTIVREATEQCERPWLPQVRDPKPAVAWLGSCALLPALGPGPLGVGGAEESPRGPAAGPGQASLKLFATTRSSQAVPLLEALERWTGCQPPPSLWLAIGPEGGWSDQETNLAQGQGWITVDLGPRILRSSTAAVAALGLLGDWRYRRWGC